VHIDTWDGEDAPLLSEMGKYLIYTQSHLEKLARLRAVCLIDGDGKYVDHLADLKSGGHYTSNVADYSGFLTMQAQALSDTGYIANQAKALELEVLIVCFVSLVMCVRVCVCVCLFVCVLVFSK
jgi:hypothetical protein